MKNTCLLVLAIFLFSGPSLYSQDAQSPPSDYVSRTEYDKLKAEHEAMKQEMEALKKAVAGMAKGTAPAASAEGPNGDSKSVTATPQADEIGELRDELAKVKETAESAKPGTTGFLLTGYGFAGLTDRKDANSTFNAGFTPILLWSISDRLFFESELEIELEDSETHIGLEYAHLSYLLNDYITLGIGKFLSPSNPFAERFHPAWINKLPDQPLAVGEEGGLLPFTELGAQLHGGFAIGPTKLGYSFYVSNGPQLVTDDSEEAGHLSFENFTDNNNNKAVGGRIGFFPIPELEIGYSAQFARVDAPETSASRADVILQGVDLNYIRDIEWLKGGIEVRAQWAWSHVDRLTYDPDGAFGFGPVSFSNNRNGGYAQLAYRPYKVKLPIIDKLEGIVRYDRIDGPGNAPGITEEKRWTLGLDYWLGPSTVLKAAYQFGDRNGAETGKENENAFFLQAAMGF